MTLPLTRRIARAALLVAAGAAPVVGAAGSANAAPLPQAPELGGLTQTDGAALGTTADGATKQATDLTSEAGGQLVGTLSTAGKVAGQTGKTAVPAAQTMAGQGVGTAGTAVGQAAGTATEQGALPGTDVVGGGLPGTDVVGGALGGGAPTLPAL
ncbi:ATP-binding protein [Streptomyces sp. NPDC000410]|uniref:ATP-binding protein n=1 Tax=Streptomyces sp. NPDC000410 TaxID=3154254 RepID=UPI00333075E8